MGYGPFGSGCLCIPETSFDPVRIIYLPKSSFRPDLFTGGETPPNRVSTCATPFPHLLLETTPLSLGRTDLAPRRPPIGSDLAEFPAPCRTSLSRLRICLQAQLLSCTSAVSSRMPTLFSGLQCRCTELARILSDKLLPWWSRAAPRRGLPSSTSTT